MPSTKPPVPLERDIQRNVLAYLGFRKILAWRNQTQGTWDAAKGVYRSKQTLKGVPDVLGILPDGRFMGIEIKRPGQHLRPEQAYFQQEALKARGFCVCVHSVAEIEAALKAEGYK